MPVYIVRVINVATILVAVCVLFIILAGNSTAEPEKINNKIKLLPIKDILADRVLGDPSAEVTIIEYASMTCSHCAAFHAGQFQILKKEYIKTGKVKFIYRDFPLDGLALAAAMMARCAPKERYYPIVNIIFQTQQNWANKANPSEALSQIGLLSGISKDTYKACIANTDIYEGLVKIRNQREQKFKILSTPTIIVNNNTVTGGLSVKNLRQVLDAELVKTKSNKH